MSDTIQMLTRRAPAARADKLNRGERTFEGIWSTGSAVKRRSWSEGEFIEELSMDPKHIRLDRLNKGASVLDSHSGYSMRNRVGSVVPGSVRVENGKAYATIRLSTNELGESLLRDLEAGHRLHLSPGYRTFKVEKTERRNQLPIHRAVDWEPYEISVVLVPADANAHTRAQERIMDPAEIVEEVELTPAPATRKRGLRIAERRAMIAQMASRLKGVDPADVEEFVRESSGQSEAEIRSGFFELWTEAHNKSAHRTDTRADVLANERLDDPAAFCRAATTALLDRIHDRPSEGIASAVFADGEAAFGRRILQNSGVDTAGWSDQRVMRSYVTTSDFALIAGAVANVHTVETYRQAAAPIAQVFGSRNVPDFNVHTEGMIDWTTLRMGQVNEHGEFRASIVDETGEPIQLHTHGGITGLTRQILINAAGALGDMARMQGEALAAHVATNMVSFIEQGSHAGPKMRDGTRVFHATRGNIEDLATYDQQVTASEMMRLRGKQARRKGKGDAIVGRFPRLWLVHPDFEGYALQVLASVTAAEAKNVNPVAGRFTIISEPRLTDPTKSWILADPAEMKGAVKVSLTGEEEPHTESRAGFEIDGVQFKIRLDIGFGWLEWRSWTRLDHNSVDPN